MTRRIRNGSGAQPIDINLLTRATNGYGVVRGTGNNCATVLGDDGTGNIEATCQGGAIAIDGERIAVAEQSVTLNDGDPLNPRRDMVYANSEGDVTVRQGTPASTAPETAVRWEAGVPSLPDARNLDGVPLLGVHIPAGAAIEDLFVTAATRDLRVFAPKSDGAIPNLDSDPSDEELLAGGSRIWNNTGTSPPELRYYDSAAQDVYQINRTSLRSVGTSGGGNDPILVEDFDDPIDANWQTEDDDLEAVAITTSNVFQGSGALEYTNPSDSVKIWSFPGDGLGAYSAPGDTVRIAIDASAGEAADVGIAKESSNDDRPGNEYRAVVDHDGARFAIYRADGYGTRFGADMENTLAAENGIGYGSGYHIVEFDYDGSGRGQHDARLYTTANGSKDTLLSSLSASKDTTYRGRGLAIGCVHETRWDALDVLK
jgi:hypothetical protein